MFSCEFWEISKNTFSTEHTRSTASETWRVSKILKAIPGTGYQTKYDCKLCKNFIPSLGQGNLLGFYKFSSSHTEGDPWNCYPTILRIKEFGGMTQKILFFNWCKHSIDLRCKYESENQFHDVNKRNKNDHVQKHRLVYKIFRVIIESTV